MTQPEGAQLNLNLTHDELRHSIHLKHSTIKQMHSGMLDFMKAGVSPCQIITQDSHFDPPVPVGAERAAR